MVATDGADGKLPTLAYSEYWDKRYADEKPGDSNYEWFRTWNELSKFLERRLYSTRPPQSSPRILHLGSGKSEVPLRLADRGYNDQLCLDFSIESVRSMTEEHARDGLEWKVQDICQMDDVASETIDVAFDKATLDAMVDGESLVSPPAEVLDLTSRYMREVYRVLKPDGFFLYITYKEPFFISKILNCEGTDWLTERDVLSEPGAISYYGFVLRKR